MVIVREPSLFSVMDVPKANTGEFPPLIKFAFHVPLTVLALELLLEPQPISTTGPPPQQLLPQTASSEIPWDDCPKGALC